MRGGIQRGCYESELCLRMLSGVFIPPILLKLFLNGTKWVQAYLNLSNRNSCLQLLD